MQLLDGFIAGIYNYCDRWCETCPFTSRCRVFASNAELDASLDAQFLMTGAGLLRSAAAMHANLMTDSATETSWCDDEDDPHDDGEAERSMAMAMLEAEEEAEHIPEAHLEICARADDYLSRADRWLSLVTARDRTDARDPYAVIAWFHMMIAVKIDRAMRGVREAGVGDSFAAEDAAGSGKVALLGIERSHASWLALVGREQVSLAEAAPFLGDLVFLGEALERLVPGVRAFVRPAFDEPEAVARLEAMERRQEAGPPRSS